MAGKDDFSTSEALENCLVLASAGRDGLIHLFNASRNFNFHGSINYHLSAVTVVKVARSGREILSCGADRSLVLHSLDVSDTGCKISCLRRIETTGTIYDVAVDRPMDVAVTVGEDKKINAFDIQSGKLIRWFQHDGDVGDPMKVAVDGSESYLACSYSNRCIYIYDYATGETVAQATGHSGVVTGIIFLSDCTHLVSVGSDGCIFVWKLPALLSSRMLKRTKEIYVQLPQDSINLPMACNQINSSLVSDLQQKDCCKEAPVNGNLWQCCSEMFSQDGSSLKNAGFRFSISQLPKWAQNQVTNNSPPTDIDSNLSKVDSQQDFACHHSQSQSKNDEEVEVGQQCSGTLSRCLSEMDSSLSPSSPESYRASSTHWLTIHTVCMDLFDSPATCEMKGLHMQGPMTDSRCTAQGLVMETTHSNKRIRPSSLGTSIDNPPTEPNPGSREQAILHDAPFDDCKCMHTSASLNGCTDELWADKSHFSSGTDKERNGNLSAELKTEGGKSLSRSNYPSGFLVRREPLEGRKRSLCIHAQDPTSGSPRKIVSYFSPKKPSTSSLEAAGSAPLSPLRHIMDMAKEQSPSNTKIGNGGEHETLDVDKVGEAEIVRSCEEALHNLESAAENALQLFCKLATANIGEEESKRLERLHTIERKIQAITKLLLHPSNNDRCENEVNFSASNLF